MLPFALVALEADLGAVLDHVQEVQEEVVVVVAVLGAVLVAVLVVQDLLAPQALLGLADLVLLVYLVHLVCLVLQVVQVGQVLRQMLRTPATVLDCVHLPSPGSDAADCTCPPCSGHFESACCEWPLPAGLQRLV